MGYPQDRCTVRNNFGGNISFRRSVFNEITFSSKMGRIGSLQLTSDETEFSIRLSKRFPKLKIIYDPDAIVSHRIYNYRLTLKYILNRAYGDGFSKAYISKKYAGNALATENSYLRSLISKSIPHELLNVLTGKKKGDALKRLLIQISVITVFGVGFIWGGLKWRI